MASECFGVELDQEKQDFIFVGDSPNDAPMFAYFPNAIAVANIREFSDRMEARPAYVTEGRCGEGFVELVEMLVTGRG